VLDTDARRLVGLKRTVGPNRQNDMTWTERLDSLGDVIYFGGVASMINCYVAAR